MSLEESKVDSPVEETEQLNNVGSSGDVISSEITEVIQAAKEKDTVREEGSTAPESEPQPEPETLRNEPTHKTVKKKSKKRSVNIAKERKPGVYNTEIPKGGPELSMSDSLSFLFRDLKARQEAALPSEKASVKAEEKKQALIVTFDKLLFPVRIVILVLMVLMLGGKQYPWMTLGVLKGEQGISILLILTIAAMAASWQSVVRALKDIIYFRCSYETVLLIATAIGLLELASTRNQESYMPLVVMSWCLSGCAAGMTAKAHRNSLRALITSRQPTAVYSARRRFEKQDVIGKAPGDNHGFVRNQAQPDVWHWGWTYFGIIYIFLVLVAAVYLSAKTQQNIFTILSMLFCVSMPVGLVTCCARPYLMLSRCLSGQGVLEGWSGAKHLYGRKHLFIYDSDLFPKGNIMVKGYKLYDRYDLRTVTTCAASLLEKADNGLLDALKQPVIQSGAGLAHVDSFESMEGGCHGFIQNRPIIMGTYEYMQLMGIMPPQNAPRNSVFLAIGGRLAAVYALEYQVTRGASAGLKRLTRELMLVPMLVTKQFAVTPAFVAKQFHSEVTKIASPKFEARRALSNPAFVYSGNRCGYVLKDGVAAYSRLAAGGRRVYRMGKYLTVLSILMTAVFLFMTVMAISVGNPVIAAPRLLLLQLILLLVVEIFARITIRR